MSYRRREIVAAWGFIIPALLLLLVFIFYPALRALITSFQHSILINPDANTFVGLENYILLLQDYEFWRTLGHTFYFAIVVIPVQTAIAFCLAMLVQKKVRGVGWFRLIYFIPVAVSFVIASAVFRLIYNSEYGMFNIVLNSLGLPSLNFLSDPSISMIGIIILGIWHAMGYFMIIILAGLNQIPIDLYEAAETDGASRIQKFLYITLPLMKRTLSFVLIITTMDAFKIFIPIYVVTAGGPAGSTRPIVQFIYETAFYHMNLGYAIAASVLYFIIVFSISIIQLRLFRSDVEH